MVSIRTRLGKLEERAAPTLSSVDVARIRRNLVDHREKFTAVYATLPEPPRPMAVLAGQHSAAVWAMIGANNRTRRAGAERWSSVRGLEFDPAPWDAADEAVVRALQEVDQA